MQGRVSRVQWSVPGFLVVIKLVGSLRKEKRNGLHVFRRLGLCKTHLLPHMTNVSGVAHGRTVNQGWYSYYSCTSGFFSPNCPPIRNKVVLKVWNPPNSHAVQQRRAP